MFKIGICYPMGWNIEALREQLIALKEMGYEGLELWAADLEKLDIARTADLFQEVGMSCAQICPYFDFVNGQEAWDKTMRIAEQYVAWSVQLGKPLVRVFTGSGVGPSNATEVQWDAAIRGLQSVCDMGAVEGVRFALECHGGSLMEDTPNTLRLLKGVARPNLGVNLQLPLKDGHEPIDVSINELGPYTWHAHSHNYTQLIKGELLPLGEGVLDYEDILPRLMAFGFDGYISIEHASHEGKRDPWEIAAIEGKYLTVLRNKLLK